MLEIQGSEYLIRLHVHQQERTYTRTSDHYYDYECTDFWWAGEGAIHCKPTKGITVFLLTTKRSRKNNVLSQTIGFEIGPHLTIPNFENYIDYIAYEWRRQILANITDKIIIPWTEGPKLNTKDLIANGLILEPNGQRCLPLSDNR